MAKPEHRGVRVPSLTTTWGLLAWLLVPITAFITVGPVWEADVYWHVRMGADILANSRFGGDPSWTYGPADAGWVTTQAGAEILLHAIYAVGSWPGLMIFRVVMAALVMVSLLLACSTVLGRRPTLVVDRAAGLVALLTFGTMAQFVQERPQSLSLLLLPWLGVVLLRVMYADRWPRWWVTGLVVMVWAWFHGAAALVGPLLAAAALIHALGVGGLRWLPPLAASIKRGWPVVLAAVVAPMIGPAGLGYYAQAAKIQSAASLRIIEWSPPDANSAYVWLALAMLTAWGIAVVHLAAGSGRVWRTMRMDLMLIVAMLVAMTSAGRYLGIGVLLLAPLVARRVGQAWGRPPVRVERIRRSVAAVILGIVSLAVVVVTVAAAADVRPVGRDNPWRVWQGLAAVEGERRVFVDYSLGGQAGLLTGLPVSIDGRADRYGGSRIDANQSFVNGRPGWPDTLAEYPGTTDIVVPSVDAIVPQLTAAGWTAVCTDASYTWLTAPGVSGACPD